MLSIRNLYKLEKFVPLRRCLSTQQVIERESKYGAHNYHPLPVALNKGQGVSVFFIKI